MSGAQPYIQARPRDAELQIDGVEHPVTAVDHPYRLTVGPDAAQRVAAAFVQGDVLRSVASAILHRRCALVGIGVVLGVHHPERVAVGPDALRVEVVDERELPARDLGAV